MKKSILIVEDENELCMTLGDRLISEGYNVDFAPDGDSGLEKATQLPFDLIVLDIMLPNRSGLDVCTEIRRAGFTYPILLLTARSQIFDKVIGLKMGADDYVTKPFDTFELMARIEALLRRTQLQTRNNGGNHRDNIQCGPLIMDVRKVKVTHHGETINLTSREFQLLRYLMEHQEVTVSRDELLQEVWGHRSSMLTRTVDVHIASLRQKLEESPKNPQIILTIPGIGYRFQI